MMLGPIAFLSPLLLGGLLALPLIWWLLRGIPPSPQRIAFPPTRILVGIENREKTPAKTPWWL
ncbi:MAG TPA: BatA domain-containing protein, partial [Hyphomicrobiaceae bacterium]|nr:BatA domain-containing protein [Hyphomicrobiaceae bacterium]